MSIPALSICPTCNQPLTLEEQRHAFCHRCGKRVAELQSDKAIQTSQSAGTPNDVLPRFPLLFLAAAFILLSIYPPFPLVAFVIFFRIFILSPKVFGLVSAMLLVAAAACSYYTRTRSSRWRSVEIALCAAAILVTTVWGITVKDVRSVTLYVNYLLCIVLAQVTALLACECAAAGGHMSLARWMDVPQLVLIFALIARLGLIFRPSISPGITAGTGLAWWLFVIALGGYLFGMLWISCGLWVLSLSSSRHTRAFGAPLDQSRA